jgi:hypothetical protein
MPDTGHPLCAQDSADLEDLSWNWGGAYDLAVTRAGWVAKRLDNGRALVAASAGELRELIVADYAAEPVSRECAGS